MDVTEDAARAVGEGVLAALTGPVGILLARLLGRWFPKQLDRRVTAWQKDAQQAINELQRRGFDLDDLREDEAFCGILMDATAAALRTHHQEKRDALRNAVVNAVLLDFEETRLRVFMRFVEEIEVHEIVFLDFLADPGAFLDKKKMSLPGPPAERMIEQDALLSIQSPRSLASLARTAVGLPPDLIEIVRQDLVRKGLAQDVQLNELVVRGRRFASALGEDFVQFVSEPAAE